LKNIRKTFFDLHQINNVLDDKELKSLINKFKNELYPFITSKLEISKNELEKYENFLTNFDSYQINIPNFATTNKIKWNEPFRIMSPDEMNDLVKKITNIKFVSINKRYETLVIKCNYPINEKLVPVYIKIFPNTYCLYESQIYRYLFQKLSDFSFSQETFIKFIDCFSAEKISNVIDKIKESMFKYVTFKYDMQDVDEIFYGEKRFFFLITENTQGCTLGDWITLNLPLINGRIITDEIKQKLIITNLEQNLIPIIFKIIYAIHLLDLFGIHHNDLHYDNIIINELPTPIQQIFCFSGISIPIYSKFIVKIFDFNMSFLKTTNESGELYSNDIVDYFTETRGYVNNSLSSNHDLWYISNFILSLFVHFPNLLNFFISEIINPILLNNDPILVDIMSKNINILISGNKNVLRKYVDCDHNNIQLLFRFCSNFSVDPDNRKCCDDVPNQIILNPNAILTRYLTKFSNQIFITPILGGYYKKYIKYKQKYLNLKKIFET